MSIKSIFVISITLLITLSQGYVLTQRNNRGLIEKRMVKSPLLALEPDDSKIVGGVEAVPHAYPYVVAIFIDEIYFCGGTIIDPNWILTAAHCLDGAYNAEVIAGAHNIRESEPEQEIQNSDTFYLHEEYSAVLAINDIALIYLPTALTLTDSISTIGLLEAEPSAGSLTTELGWGDPVGNGGGQIISDVLMVATGLPTMTDDDCLSFYSDLDENVLCVDTSTGAGVCDGDSGGPLVDESSGLLLGVSSFSSSDGCAEGPDAFSSVPDFLSWIRDTTGLSLGS